MKETLIEKVSLFFAGSKTISLLLIWLAVGLGISIFLVNDSTWCIVASLAIIVIAGVALTLLYGFQQKVSEAFAIWFLSAKNALEDEINAKNIISANSLFILLLMNEASNKEDIKKAFEKSTKALEFFDCSEILRSGHLLPADENEFMELIDLVKKDKICAKRCEIDLTLPEIIAIDITDKEKLNEYLKNVYKSEEKCKLMLN